MFKETIAYQTAQELYREAVALETAGIFWAARIKYRAAADWFDGCGDSTDADACRSLAEDCRG